MSQPIEEKRRYCYIEDRPKNDSRKTIRYKYNPDTDSLGEGGFGKVFKVIIDKGGEDEEKSKKYALKQIPKSLLIGDKERKLRALTEIRIHRQLNHKYICKFEHSFEDKDYIYIVLEFCPNQSLLELMHKRGKLKEFEVRFFMFQVLCALQYLRRQKIIHRDLTLSNIFLADSQSVKIGDFGLSFKETENNEKPDLFCGTEGYVAPETSNYKFNYKTDVFAFGVCIYMLITGKSLFPSSPAQTMDLIEKNEVPYDRSMKCSDQARDLMNRIFQLEGKRIDIDDIYKHPFFNKGKGLEGVKLPVLNIEPGLEKEKINEIASKFQSEIEELDKGIIITNVCTYGDYLYKKTHKENGERVHDSDLRVTFSGFPSKKKNLIRGSQADSGGKSPRQQFKNKKSTSGLSISVNSDEGEAVFALSPTPSNGAGSATNAGRPPSQKNSNSNIADVKRKSSGEIQSIRNASPVQGTTNFDPTLSSLESNHSGKGFNFEKLIEMEYSKQCKKNTFKENEYVIKDYIDLSGIYGLAYMLSSGDIGIHFNDGTKMTKLNSTSARILYHYVSPLTQKEVTQNIILQKKVSGEIEKKIASINSVQKEFMKKDKIPSIYYDLNFDGIYLVKWKKTYNAYFFVLSNRNIDVRFKDKSGITFFCNEGKIKYFDERTAKVKEIECGENFTNFECHELGIKKKIVYAINELRK